jgi:hypothetical protein
MELFNKTQYEQLIKNGSDDCRGEDHHPVVKLFLTNSACTWLLTELDPEQPDIAFGLCDLGMGFPELGYVSIDEIRGAQAFLRLLERDRSFKADYPISVYARAARRAEHIVTDQVSLQTAAKPQP